MSTKESILEKRIERGEIVKITMKGVLHEVWRKPKEDFGYKHTLTFKPLVKNMIYRTFGDLLLSLAEVDPNWDIAAVKEIEVDIDIQ